MARSACEDVMLKAVPNLTDEELERLITDLRTAKKARDAVGDAMQDAAMAAADDVHKIVQTAALIEKRNALINLNVRMRAESFVMQFKPNATGMREGFFALVAGTERLKIGGRASAAAEQKQFTGDWIGGLAHDLEKAGLREVFSAGALDREISRALWQLSRDAPDMAGLPAQAVDIAKIVHTYQETARITRNRFGSWIGKLEGYIVRQSHDMYKIRAAGFEAWRAGIEQRLDWKRIEAEHLTLNREGFLRRVFDDLSSGDHMHAIATHEMSGFTGPSNIAKRASQERTLHFLDADAWFDYNAQFGVGTLNEAVLTGLQSAARTAGLMKVLGTNPQANLEAVMSRIADRMSGKDRADFKSAQGQVVDLLAHVDGRASIPGNATAGKVGANLRAWQSMAKLGGALVSSINDLATFASEARYTQGKGFLSGITDAIGKVVEGRPKGEQKDMLSSLGVFHESMLGEVFARFDAQDVTGKTMTWAMQKFFRMNGLSWWTESLRSASALSNAHYMALQSGKSWDNLPEGAARSLSLYGIDSGKWDLLRQAGVKLADDRVYLTPEGMAAVSRNDIAAYLQKAGQPVNDTAIRNARDDIAAALRSFYIDRAHHAVIEPDARSRWWLLRGTQAGTAPGELMRYIAQFKGFPTALVQQVFGRELYGYGADTLREAGMKEFQGIAQLVLYTTLFGYASMSIKDMLKGRNPRDPLDPKTMGAAMLQGGALGIYGDFIIGESSRFGRSALETVGGPVLSTFADLDEIRARWKHGDDVAASAFKLGISNTPFLNLFYVKPALDYLVIYQMQEAMNPGYLRRMERRIEKENDQTFFLRPSEVAR
jgi:hypothetical protein